MLTLSSACRRLFFLYITGDVFHFTMMKVQCHCSTFFSYLVFVCSHLIDVTSLRLTALQKNVLVSDENIQKGNIWVSVPFLHIVLLTECDGAWSLVKATYYSSLWIKKCSLQEFKMAVNGLKMCIFKATMEKNNRFGKWWHHLKISNWLLRRSANLLAFGWMLVAAYFLEADPILINLDNDLQFNWYSKCLVFHHKVGEESYWRQSKCFGVTHTTHCLVQTVDRKEPFTRTRPWRAIKWKKTQNKTKLKCTEFTPSEMQLRTFWSTATGKCYALGQRWDRGWSLYVELGCEGSRWKQWTCCAKDLCVGAVNEVAAPKATALLWQFDYSKPNWKCKKTNKNETLLGCFCVQN